MTAPAPTLEAFFTQPLAGQLQASPHTIAAYRDTFRLLLHHAQARTGKKPSQLDLADLDAPAITAFLSHLEHDRGNAIRTRNARLAAIHSLFAYAALSHPEHAALISRVLAIPPGRFDRALVTYLTQTETGTLLAVPDRATRNGRRDHALLALAVQTGLRVSELTGLRRADVHPGTGTLHPVHRKGPQGTDHPAHGGDSRRALRLAPRAARRTCQPAVPRPSRHATDPQRRRAHSHQARPAPQQSADPHWPPSTYHRTRCATPPRCSSLHAGVDITVIALWLGHESTETTQIYLHADMTLKEKALARTTPPGTKPGRYQPPDALLAFLESL